MYAITVFGDSVTFGVGGEKSQGWCHLLKEEFQEKDYYNRVYNLGIPGDTTTDILKRFDAECEARVKFKREGDRNVILISIGINDSRTLVSDRRIQTHISDFEENIKTLIKRAKHYTNEVYFIGLTPVDDEVCENYEETVFMNRRVKSYNEAIKQICEEREIPFLDMYSKFKVEGYEELLDDGLHPNFEGYEKMYRLIKEFLTEHKVL